jgi:hypothetical protein
MKKSIVIGVSVFLILISSFIIIVFGHLIGNTSFKASAGTLTSDEALLCVELNTYIRGPLVGYLDDDGFDECIFWMGQD